MGIVYNTSTFTTDGLLCYFDAGNVGSYPGVGTTWTDFSTYNNNATLTGGITYNSANRGYFTFSGVSTQYAQLATASKLNVPYTGKTVFIVARFSSGAWTNGVTQYRALYGNSTAASYRNFNTYIQHNSSNEFKLYYSTDAVGGSSSAIPLTNDQWFIVTVTQTADTTYYYYNGVLFGTTSGSTLSQYKGTSTLERIGWADNYWKGDIASVALYSRALSATEVQQNFTTHRARYGL